MFADIYTPRARHWAVPMLVGVLVSAWAFAQREPATAWLLFAVAAVFGAWSLVNFIHHASHAVVGVVREQRELDFRMSQNYLVEKIAGMTDAQLSAIRVGRAIIEIIPSENGPVEKLWGTEAYLPMVWHILVNSTEQTVYPIRNFFAETYHFDMVGDHALDDLQQARNIHSWLVLYGFAKEARANQSASWVKPHGPDKVLAMLGLTRESYLQDNVPVEAE